MFDRYRARDRPLDTSAEAPKTAQIEGGIEAARLLGNTHALVWTLMGRSAAALRMGDVELALATAQEGFDLSQAADSNFHSAEGAADLAAALLETGQPEPAVELLLESAGGEELVLIGGSPRARYLEVLTRCWLALGRHAEAERSAAAAQAWASAVQLPMAVAWANRAGAAVELDTGDPARAVGQALASAAAADQAGAPVEAAPVPYDLWLGSWETALSALATATQSRTLSTTEAAAHKAAIAAEREVVTKQFTLLLGRRPAPPGGLRIDVSIAAAEDLERVGGTGGQPGRVGDCVSTVHKHDDGIPRILPRCSPFRQQPIPRSSREVVLDELAGRV